MSEIQQNAPDERAAAVSALAAACERAAQAIRAFLAVPASEQERARREAEAALVAVEDARRRIDAMERARK